ncbi:T9SS type A sorting domain-containing protein [Flavobacterium sp.]|uniref:T9SS type A sorting domain-containing protein n=1 Tax=Flavobacterium sp. TaxID=239 RepID=UPI0026271309|nr:T9SS type A sorting domain-containing protein [Flavobacterium sp.]
MKKITFIFLFLFTNIIANGAIISNIVMPVLPNLELCDQNNDGFENFDLSVQTPLILAAQTTSVSNYNVSYHLTLTDANVGANSLNVNNYANISNPQTIYARVVNITTSEFEVGNFQLIVNPTVVPIFVPMSPLCQNSIPPILPSTSVDGIVGTWSPSTIDTSTVGSQIFTFTPYYDQCATVITIAISVVAVSPSTLVLSSPTSTTNQTVCPYQSITNITYEFGGSASGVEVNGLPSGLFSSITNSTLTITGAPTSYGDFDFTVTTIGGCTVETLNGSITVTTPPFANTFLNINLYQCGSPQGIANFDLSGQPSTILNGQSGLSIGFYPSLLDATNNVNSISNLTSYTNVSPFTQELGIRITDLTTGCYKIFPVMLVAKPSPAIIGIGYTIVNNSGIQTITVDVDGTGIYSYSIDGGPFQTSPVFQNVLLGNHTLTISDTLVGCSTIINDVVVNLTTTAPPTGNVIQQFNQGATLADLSVVGQNILWYSGANKSSISSPLPLNTLLVDGTTYYASQKIGGYESASRLPVLVQLSLKNTEFEINSLAFQPNPVIDFLNLKSTEIIDNIVVYNLVGQEVFSRKLNNSDVKIDLSTLNSGIYLLKISSINQAKYIKISKK